MLYCKISAGDGKPIANINSGKPRCSMFSFNGRYYQHTVQTTNTGTTTKYYTTLVLANAGAVIRYNNTSGCCNNWYLLYQK
jgi:hypothetical protein